MHVYIYIYDPVRPQDPRWDGSRNSPLPPILRGIWYVLAYLPIPCTHELYSPYPLAMHYIYTIFIWHWYIYTMQHYYTILALIMRILSYFVTGLYFLLLPFYLYIYIHIMYKPLYTTYTPSYTILFLYTTYILFTNSYNYTIFALYIYIHTTYVYII